MKNGRNSMATSAAIALLIGLTTGCLAQTDTGAPSLLWVNVTRVKPDMTQEWEKIQQNEFTPALKKGGVPFREVWQTAMFGDPFEYALVTPIQKFAQFDGPSALVKALDKDGAATLLNKVRRCVADTHGSAVRFRPDLSIMGNMQEAELAVISTVRVASGRSQDFENWLKNDYVPALKKAEPAGYMVHQTVFGGNANDWVTLLLIKKFGDLDAGPMLNRAVGEEAASKIIAKAAGIVISLERSVSRHRADLSYSAAPAKAGGAQ